MVTHKLFKLIFLGVFCLFVSIVAAQGQATNFTFQGKLTDAGSPANGQYDLQFKLYDVSSGGTYLAIQTIENVQVTQGVFTVTLDFGSTLFVNNTGRFLEVAVRPGSSTGAFTTISPRQELTAAPYAIQALQAGKAENSFKLGGISPSSFMRSDVDQTFTGRTLTIDSSSGLVVAGALYGSGSQLTNINASAITTDTLNDARLSSNVALLNRANTFTNLMDIQSGGSLRIRGNSQIDLIADSSVFLDFPSIPQGGSAALTVPVANATFLDVVMLGLPSVDPNLVYTAYVNSPGVVTVRCNNVGTAGAINPPSQGFRVAIVGFVF